jgi:hypothetical protein
MKRAHAMPMTSGVEYDALTQFDAEPKSLQ